MLPPKKVPSTIPSVWKKCIGDPIKDSDAEKWVGVRGFELPASTSRTWRANQLRYTPSAVKASAKLAFYSISAKFIAHPSAFFLKKTNAPHHIIAA